MIGEKFEDRIRRGEFKQSEPLWAKLTIPADGATRVGPGLDFFMGEADGINQSPFVERGVLRGCSFRVMSVGLTIQDRAGMSNFDRLQHACVMIAEVADQVVMRVPADAGVIANPPRELPEGPEAPWSVTSHDVRGWETNHSSFTWGEGMLMRWRLAMAQPETMDTPLDGVPDFSVSLMLFGYRIVKLIA